ncbi:hypothetical protein EKO27_g4300 [Xylaria grammica]|uniref:Uncharacterized protein n=1 Tax=Xylaria grammica TaxID=363999 RepID=A0A439D8R5_9PEZI|nr:hypothetical protein EKO27_g4300 [Xylaria grammica]
MYRFSYTPKREYSYKWLTPLVVVGGIIAIAIVLFVNITTQSYELVATTVNDINAAQARYLQPNGLLKFLRHNSGEMSCDNVTLPVNSEVFTKNYALPYTIRSVWQQYADGTKENQNALTYREHALNDCNVTSVGITVNGKYSQSPLITARSRVGLVIDTQVTCAIEVDTRGNQKTCFNLESTYNLIDDDIPRFLLKNEKTSPSLFWGQSLLSLYYLVTSHAYYNASRGRPWGDPALQGKPWGDPGSNTYSAYINLTRQSTTSVGGLEEVLSDDFFYIYCTTEDNVCRNNTIPLLSKGGGTGKNITVPNMLADTNLLANLTSNVTNEVNAWLALQDSPDHGSTMKFDTSLANTSFDPFTTPVPALGVNTSYFSVNYICQVPMLKPLGTRFIAILSSSLVLLHTIWKIFWFVFDLIVQSRLQQQANHVVGVHTAGDTSLEDLEEKAGQKANNYIQVNQAERHLD